VLARATEIARDIADNTAPASVGVTKELFYDMLEQTDRESAFYREWEAFRWMGRGSDSSEGAQSFLAKRTPRFASSKHEALPMISDGWERADG
jgi:enoyl-CoA hydratase/carnithine racemase